MKSPSRQPKGTDAGGQFAPSANSESTVDLLDVETTTTDSQGNKSWYVDGQLHREEGPAVEHADGSLSFYDRGELIMTLTAVSASP
jgi:hypothetical protein